MGDEAVSGICCPTPGTKTKKKHQLQDRTCHSSCYTPTHTIASTSPPGGWLVHPFHCICPRAAPPLSPHLSTPAPAPVVPGPLPSRGGRLLLVESPRTLREAPSINKHHSYLNRARGKPENTKQDAQKHLSRSIFTQLRAMLSV